MEALRGLPSVDRVLRTEALQSLLETYRRDVLVGVVRDVLESWRGVLAAGGAPPALSEIGEEVTRRVLAWTPRPLPLINATGVILHTNLGRAPLSREAVFAVEQAAGYSDLEFRLGGGDRGSRQEHVAGLLRALTGGQAAHVAGNNAAATLLVLTALAKGRDVIVSRGQAVEIGGGFRVPVILRQSGARLVEVGTTNRTRLADYEDAITDRTAAILHVHSSNFRIVGFSEEVGLVDLADLAHRNGVLLIDDNGSGSLLDTAAFGLAHEPTPVESLRAGADVVTFSGDKLLGGPQAGLIVGSAEALDRVGRHPLARATRPDKLALAALSATLLSYLRGDAPETLPVWQMIAQPAESLAERASTWQSKAGARGLEVELEAGESTVGGGSLPGETLPTSLIVLPRSIRAERLRRGDPPVVARTRHGRVMLDLRTVDEAKEDALLEAVLAAANR